LVKGAISNTKVILLLTVVIAVGSVFTILSFLSTSGLIGQIEEVRVLTESLEIPVPTIVIDAPPPASQPVVIETVIPPPSGFQTSDQDLISAFLDSIGATVTETFTVVADVMLVDANQEQVIEQTFLQVQPLDPRTVITVADEEIEPLRFFINTDFSSQLADNGKNFHQFSGWDVIRDSGGAFGVPITITTTTTCSGVPNTGLCVQTVGNKNKDDSTFNGGVLYGLTKVIDMSDWTREGQVFVRLDYSCNPAFSQNSQIKLNVGAQTSIGRILPCVAQGSFSEEVSSLMGNSNTLTMQFGAGVLNPDKFRVDAKYNNAQVIGNSIAKRDAIETLQTLSIIQNDQEQRILDLGFIDIALTGKTIFDNEQVSVTGTLETRIDDKTISKHDVTGFGVTANNEIALRIEGQDSLIFKLDEQFYEPNSFHTFKVLLNDFIVNVGEGADQRTFEYHIPFLTYFLEFNVLPNEIVAFNTENRAISVSVNDSTLITCGLSAGSDPIAEPKVLPPVVSVISGGLTLATTNPESGSNQLGLGERAEFCSTIPELPRNTVITFKIGNSFFDVNSPATQANYFVKCTDQGCSSNIGFVSMP